MESNGQDTAIEPLQTENPSQYKDEKKKQNKRKKLRLILKEVTASSSFSGVSNIASARSKCGILFWTLLLLGGLFGFSMNLQGLITRLMSGPVIETYVPEGGKFVWPDITICNPMNPIPFWKLPYQLPGTWRKLRKKAITYGREIFKRFPRYRLNDVLAMCSLNPKEALFHDVSPMVFDASLNSIYSDESKVGSYDSSDKFKWNFGKQFYARFIPNRYPTPCMTFNLAGFQNSSKLLKISETTEEIKFFVMMVFNSYKEFNSYYDNRRLAVYISEAGRTISLRDRHYGVPGSDIYMEVSMSRIERLQNRGKCVSEPFTVDQFNTLLTDTDRYIGDYKDCEMFVTQKRTVEQCGCYTTKIPLYKVPSNQTFPMLCLNMTIYSPKQLVDNLYCMNKVEDDPGLETEVTKTCEKYKLSPCKEIRYGVNLDGIPWSEEVNKARQMFIEALGYALPIGDKGDIKTFLRKNMLFLNIRKSTRKPDAIREEYSYGFPQFISDVGGIVGLWLGFNIISLFELLEMICLSGRFCIGR